MAGGFGSEVVVFAIVLIACQTNFSLGVDHLFMVHIDFAIVCSPLCFEPKFIKEGF